MTHPPIEKSLVNGTLTISPAKAAAVHRNISSLNDDAKIANNSGSSKNNAENLAESPRNIGTESGNAMSDAENAQAVADSLGLDVEVMTSTDGLSGRKANAKGWFDTKTGKIVIVMPNHSDMEDVMRTILHEGVAHYGLRKLCGEHFDTFLDNVYNNASDEIREEIDKRSASMPESKNADERRRIATEEYLAELAEETDFEDAAFKSWWQRIKAFFSEMLEKAGLRLADKLTDNDLRYYLWRSYKNLKDGGVMDYIGTAEDIAKQATLGVGNYRQESDDRFKMGDAASTFVERQKQAEVNRGTVLSGLNEAEVKVVAAEPHSFKSFVEAEQWADDNIVRTYSNEETGGKGEVRISKAAIKKYLSESAVSKSASKDVHLSVLKMIPDVIRESIEAEEHADYSKNSGVRNSVNAVNKDVLVHRLYSAVSMDGNLYRVKITMKEYLDANKPSKPHSYEATKIELLDTPLAEPYEGQSQHVEMMPNSSNSENEVLAGTLEGTDSIFPNASTSNGVSNVSNVFVTVAKLLKDVEKSYDSGKKLLDESKKTDVQGSNAMSDAENLRFRDGEPTFGEKISKARTSAVRALNAMALAEHKRGKSEETLRLAREAVANFISIGLASGNMTHVGKLDLQKMLTMVKNVPNYKTLSRYLELSQTIISNAEINAQRKAIDDLLKLRKQKQNQKGVSEATAVDDKTRMVFEYMHGRTKELLLTPIDEELNGINKEIYAIRKQLPELSGDEKDTAIDRIKELSEQAKALRERRKELTAENRSEVEKLWRERMEFLNAKLADDNEDLTDDEMNELEALTILKMINDADLMESVGTVDSETGARGLSIKSLTERKDELAREIHDLYDKRRNTPDREAKKAVTAEIKAKENEIDQCDVIINSIKQKQADLLTSAAEAMRQIVEDGRDRLRSQLTAERARKGDIIRNGYNDIKRGKSWEQRHKFGKKKGQIKDRTKRVSVNDFLHGLFASPLESLEYMCQKVSTSLRSMGWLYRHFIEGEEGAIAAERDYDEAKIASNAFMNAASQDILKMSFVKAADKFSQVEESTGIKIWNRDEMIEQELQISKGTAMYIYQLWNMHDGKMKLQDMGFSESSIAQVLDFIGDDLKRMADWMVEEFYPQLRERMNERHKEIYHTSMARIDNYVPIKIDNRAIAGKTDLNSGTTFTESLNKINGSLISRTVNTMPIDLTRTAFDILLEHADKNEEWIAFARVRQDLSYLLNSTVFQNTMNANDAESYQDFVAAVRVATRMPEESTIETADKIALALTNGYVTGAIAFRLCTAAKQILSFPAFVAYSQDPKFLALLTRNVLTPYTNYTWAKKNSPIFAKRIEDGLGGDGDIAREFALLKDNFYSRGLKKFGKIGMMPNKLVDGLTYSAGARAIYQYEYDRILARLKKQGMEEDEAKNLAHKQAMIKADINANSSQQSSMNAFLSQMQKDKSLMSRALTTFRQSVIGYQRHVVLSAIDIARYVGNHDKLVRQYMNDFGVEKNEAEAALNNRIRKDVVTLAIFGFALNWIWDNGNDVIAQMTGLTGGDDDEEYLDLPKDANWTEVMKYLKYISYFLQGTVVGNALHDFASVFKYSPLSIYGSTEEAIKQISKLWDEYGITSPEAFFGVLLELAKLKGISPETFANVVIATDDLITNGWDANIALDVAFILNTTKTTRERIARSRAESFDPLEYAEVMTFALKQKDYGSLGNILLGTRVPKDNSKVKQYFDEWTNKHIGAETNARWTDEGAELMKQYRKYKVKTGAKTGMTEEEKAEFAEAHKELLKDGINTKKETPNAWLNHLELVDQYIRDAEGWLNNELKSGDMDETVVNNLVAFIAAAKKKGAELLDADSEIDSFSLEYTNFKAMLKDNQ